MGIIISNIITVSIYRLLVSQPRQYQIIIALTYHQYRYSTISIASVNIKIDVVIISTEELSGVVTSV